MEKLLAVDVALLPAVAVMERFIGLMEYDPQTPIVLDKVSCLPHVTLAMGVIAQADIARFGEVLSGFFGEAAKIEVVAENSRTYTTDNGKNLCEVTIRLTPELADFRTRVSEAVRPLFLDIPARVDMFFAPPAVDEISTKWVLKYGEVFRPHITLGQGAVKQIRRPFRFYPQKLVLCQLGNYCTCRRVLE
jgi:hypothetical protein